MEVLVVIGLLLYFIPTLISVLRRRNNTLAIFALNLFLGWSVIGWVVSLVWALSAEANKTVKVF